MSVIIAAVEKKEATSYLPLPFGILFPRPASEAIKDGGYSELSGVRSHRIDFTWGKVFVPVARITEQCSKSGDSKGKHLNADELAAAARAIAQQQQQQQKEDEKKEEQGERPWWPPSGPFVAFTGTFVDFFGLGCILPLLPFFVDSVFADPATSASWLGAIVSHVSPLPPLKFPPSHPSRTTALGAVRRRGRWFCTHGLGCRHLRCQDKPHRRTRW